MEPLSADATGDAQLDAPLTFGSVSLETVQEMSEIFISADIYGQIPQFVSNG